MFQADTIVSENMFKALSAAESNYAVRKHDRIELQLFANNAEIMMDPGQELSKIVNGGLAGGMNGNIGQQANQIIRPNYLVLVNGFCVLPMIGAVRLEGFTIGQVDSLLAIKYASFYENPFIISRIVNRRCVVFASGGARVIPLENENTNLIEVLAMSGGMASFAKASNIKLIRGQLNKPQVQIIDLTTIAGMKKAQLQIQPNDIVYVEPGRRTGIELIRESAVVFSLASSVITLAFLLTRLK